MHSTCLVLMMHAPCAQIIDMLSLLPSCVKLFWFQPPDAGATGRRHALRRRSSGPAGLVARVESWQDIVAALTAEVAPQSGDVPVAEP